MTHMPRYDSVGFFLLLLVCVYGGGGCPCMLTKQCVTELQPCLYFLFVCFSEKIFDFSQGSTGGGRLVVEGKEMRSPITLEYAK